MPKPTLGKRAMQRAVHAIENVLYRAREPFAVFVVKGEAVALRTSTARCACELRRSAVHGHLVGVYDGRADIDAVIADLEHFAAR